MLVLLSGEKVSIFSYQEHNVLKLKDKMKGLNITEQGQHVSSLCVSVKFQLIYIKKNNNVIISLLY